MRFENQNGEQFCILKERERRKKLLFSAAAFLSSRVEHRK